MIFGSSRAPFEGGVALGKFAGYPEFLRPGDGGEAEGSLDAWLDEGTQAAHERWGPEWTAAFPRGAAFGFVWGARSDDAHLCGVLAPSRDAVGRDYPLAVATRFLPGLVARAPHVVPLAFGDVLDEAYRVVDEARSTPLSMSDFTTRVQRIPRVTPDEVFRAEAEYSDWSVRTRLAEGWGAVFPGQHPLEEAAQALEAIGAALAPVSERGGHGASLVLRLPLGAGGVGAAALWLDVVRRIGRWSSAIPRAFWAVDTQGLLLLVGKVLPRTFGELWRPSSGNGFVCDGGESIPRSSRGGHLDPGRLLRDMGGEPSMSGFLDALTR